MRAILHVLKIVIYVALFGSLMCIAFFLLNVILISIVQKILCGGKWDVPFNWSFLLVIGMSIALLWRLNKNKDSFREFADDDAMQIWSISAGIVLTILILLWLCVFVGGIRKFIKRDKDPHINSLQELLEQSSELQGKTIKMNPDLYDTAAIYNDIRQLEKNANLSWKDFSSEEGGFFTKFPNYKVLHAEELMVVNNDSCKVVTYYTDNADKIDYNLQYSVSYISLPEHSSVTVFFDAVERYILKKNGGRLLSNEAYNGKGFIGRKIDVSGGATFDRLIAIVIYYNGRMYIQKVLTNNEVIDNQALVCFFNSIRLN